MRIPVDPSRPVGTITGVQVDGQAMAVVHSAAGWVMVADECPHASCPFTDDGEVADETVLICNCHGSEFDLRTGEVLLGPAEESLQVIWLKADGDVLVSE